MTLWVCLRVEQTALECRQRDTGQAACLDTLMLWAYSITPTLERWRDDCLQLEIGGCLALFRGLDPLLAQVRNDLARRGVEVVLGVGPSRWSAWLLSHADSATAVAIDQPLIQRIGSLPLTLLDDFPGQVASLERAGIRDFTALLALPRTALARRCGKALLARLDQIGGNAAEARRDFTPPPEFRDALWFGFEIRHAQELHPAIAELLQGFTRFLRNTQLDTQCIAWCLLGARGVSRTLTVRSTEAHANPTTWFELTAIQLERLQLAPDTEGIELRVTALVPATADGDDLFANPHNREPLGNLVDRLRSRLGRQAITRVAVRDEHVPECRLYHGEQPPEVGDRDNWGDAQRPFWLLPEPQPIREQGKTLHWNGPLEMLAGPERIEDNWWQTPVSRDYFLARGPDGQPLWIFQDRRSRRWFVHGIFA